MKAMEIARKRMKPAIRTFFLPALSESFPNGIIRTAEIMLKRRKRRSGITNVPVMFFAMTRMKR